MHNERVTMNCDAAKKRQETWTHTHTHTLQARLSELEASCRSINSWGAAITDSAAKLDELAVLHQQLACSMGSVHGMIAEQQVRVFWLCEVSHLLDMPAHFIRHHPSPTQSHNHV